MTISSLENNTQQQQNDENDADGLTRTNARDINSSNYTVKYFPVQNVNNNNKVFYYNFGWYNKLKIPY